MIDSAAMATTTMSALEVELWGAAGESDPELLKHLTEYFWWWGVFLPIFCALGVVGNTAAAVVFVSRQMRSLSTLLVTALMVSQSLFLVCLVMVNAPSAWLLHLYAWPDGLTHTHYLHGLQRMYLGGIVLLHIAHSLVIWYSLSLILEQYCVYNHVERLARVSSGDRAAKIIITIMNITILVHLVQFFKYVRTPVLYSTIGLYHVCMSQIYRSGSFESYDKYVYFAIFEAVPWFLTLLVLMKTLRDHHVRQKEAREEVNMNLAGVPSSQLDRVFRSARSFKIVVSLTVLYLVADLVYGVIYFVTVDRMQVNLEEEGCRVIPGSAQFDNLPSYVMFLYHFLQVVVATINFPLFLLMGKDFRRAVASCCGRQARNFSATSRLVAAGLVGIVVGTSTARGHQRNDLRKYVLRPGVNGYPRVHRGQPHVNPAFDLSEETPTPLAPPPRTRRNSAVVTYV